VEPVTYQKVIHRPLVPIAMRFEEAVVVLSLAVAMNHHHRHHCHHHKYM
jgi:hypothetical protein